VKKEIIMSYSHIVTSNYVSVMNLDTGVVTKVQSNEPQFGRAVELIKEGQIKGVWDFKTEDIVSAGPRIDPPSAPTQVEIKTTPAQQPGVSDTPTVVEIPKIVDTTKAVKKAVKKERDSDIEQPSVKGPRAKEQVNVQLH
jgi:hypothetical protein